MLELPADIAAGLDQAGELPVLPKVVTEVMTLVRDEDVSFRKLADVIERDPGVAAAVLKVANSPIYAGRQSVANLKQALTVLGAQEVHRICLVLAVRSAFPAAATASGFDRELYWWHSGACGVAARRLVEYLALPSEGEEFAAGLLHDLGELLLDHCFPERYAAVLNVSAEEGISMRDAERRYFGGDHALVGAWLCQRWNFPDVLVQAIRYHHTPEDAGAHAPLAAVVCLADTFARVTGHSFSGERRPVAVEDTRAWGILREARGTMRDVDVAMLTFRLQDDIRACGDLL